MVSPTQGLLDAPTIEEVERRYAQALTRVDPLEASRVGALRGAFLQRRRELGLLPEEAPPVAGPSAAWEHVEPPEPKLAPPRGKVRSCIGTLLLIWGGIVLLGFLLRALGIR